MPEQAPTLDEVFAQMREGAIEAEQQHTLRSLGTMPDGPGPALDAYLDRVLEMIARLQKDIDSTNATAELRIQDITHWRDKQVESASHQIAFLQRQIEALVTQYDYDFGPNRKSKDLPHGTFGRRVSVREGVEVLDEAAALEWARKYQPRAVKVKESILKKPLLEHLKATGEVPDGCEYREAKEEFYVNAVLPGR